MGCTSSGCRSAGVYDPAEPLLKAAPRTHRRGSKPTLLRHDRRLGDEKDEKTVEEDTEEDDAKGRIAARADTFDSAASSSSTFRRIASAAVGRRASKSKADTPRAGSKEIKEISPLAYALTGSNQATLPPPPPSSSEGSVPVQAVQSTRSGVSGENPSNFSSSEVPKKSDAPLCCGNICGAIHLLAKPKASLERGSTITSQPQLPIARSVQENRQLERLTRTAELNRRFRLAKEAAKGLSLSSEEKMQLYAYEKQATEGPVRGARPGAASMLARAKWDAWAKLRCMDQEVAKQGFCALVDKFSPGWRSKAGV